MPPTADARTTEQTPLAAALSVRRLVEFLLRTGSIDSRFTRL